MTEQVASLRAGAEAAWASASIFATVNSGLSHTSPPPITCVRAGPTVASARGGDADDVGRSASDIAVPPPRSLVTGELRTWVRSTPDATPPQGAS